jgi:hypothetical protein
MERAREWNIAVSGAYSGPGAYGVYLSDKKRPQFQGRQKNKIGVIQYG